ncbi:MAG: glutamate racemase [Planctomycetota bacterium]
MNSNPIAVFDSGLGGLSVVRHLRQRLAGEDIVYFGDTARVPYGSKSRQTVVTFALEAANFLLQFEPKLIVAACNTASALALTELRSELPVPVIDVVQPGACAASARAGGRPIAVIGTEATVGSGSYPAAIRSIRPGQPVLQKACPLFVPLVEEGRSCDDPLVKMAVEEYLIPLRRQGIGVVILGCTHYPLLRAAIAECLGPEIEIIDSGQETSLAVQQHLRECGSLCPSARRGNINCYVSDNDIRFREVGSRFLNEVIENVEFVEPERYISINTAARHFS